MDMDYGNRCITPIEMHGWLDLLMYKWNCWREDRTNYKTVGWSEILFYLLRTGVSVFVGLVSIIWAHPIPFIYCVMASVPSWRLNWYLTSPPLFVLLYLSIFIWKINWKWQVSVLYFFYYCVPSSSNLVFCLNFLFSLKSHTR